MTTWLQGKRHRVAAFVAVVVSVVALTAFILIPSIAFGGATPMGGWLAPFHQASTVALPNYYAEGMVFQRDKPITVHGITDPNGTVSVAMQDDGKDASKATIHADAQGNFNAQLAAVPARLEPYSLNIVSGAATLRTIGKVYVGDVFVAAGQSNMDLNYNEYYKSDSSASANMQGIITKNDLPNAIIDTNVHFIVTDDVSSENTAEFNLPLQSFNNEGWISADADNSLSLGYLPQLFAKKLRQNEQNIPIGIIQIAWDGTFIAQHMQGGDIYNSHIEPLTGFNVAGILWYQGESDAVNQSAALSYLANFTKLISQYRQVFGQADLPFLYVQLARFGSYPEMATVRQAQMEALSTAANTNNLAMTVSIDTDKGTSALIHPLGKDILAYRMAQQWKAIQDKRAIPQGPVAVNARQSASDSSQVVVSFADGTADQLQTMTPINSLESTPEQTAIGTDITLDGFEVAGPDGTFQSATATISGKTVVVTSATIKDIREVRYLWTSNPVSVSMLYNGNLLPASPFALAVQYKE